MGLLVCLFLIEMHWCIELRDTVLHVVPTRLTYSFPWQGEIGRPGRKVWTKVLSQKFIWYLIAAARQGCRQEFKKNEIMLKLSLFVFLSLAPWMVLALAEWMVGISGCRAGELPQLAWIWQIPWVKAWREARVGHYLKCLCGQGKQIIGAIIKGVPKHPQSKIKLFTPAKSKQGSARHPWRKSH